MSYQSHIGTRPKYLNSQYQKSHLGRIIRRADSQIQKKVKQLKKIKYPIHAIQPAEGLATKISSFKNQKLVKEMKKKLIEEKEINSYRKIRGDGNCFFRALAYSYLSNLKSLTNLNQVFSRLDELPLTVCEPSSIPKQFKPFYNDLDLKLVLQNNWQYDIKYLQLSCNSNKKRVLSRLFRKYPYLDFIVILYFRSLCLNGFQKYKDNKQLKQFMKGTQQQQIKKYGQQSQGMILQICSRILKVSIQVYEVRKQQLKQYSYKPLVKHQQLIQLFYYQNHYDLLQKNSQKDLLEEKGDINIIEEDYYTQIEEKMVEGECIQCGNKAQVYQQNFLCYRCFQISKNELLNTVKSDKFVTGTCTNCGRRNQKILEMLKMCQKCINHQQQQIQEHKSPKKQLNGSPSKKLSNKCPECQKQMGNSQQCQNCIKQSFYIGRCQNCHKPTKISDLTHLCVNCTQKQKFFLSHHVGYCVQCHRKDYIDKQTKLCPKCEQQQTYFLKRTQYRKQKQKQIQRQLQRQRQKQRQRQQYKQKPRYKQKVQQTCPKCSQPINSDFHQIKCLTNLTKGQIGIPKAQKLPESNKTYQQKTCRICNQMKMNQQIFENVCQSCFNKQKKIQQQKDSKSSIKTSGIRNLGQKMSQQAVKCRQCSRPFYSYMSQSGLCIGCKNKTSSIFR